ncbi:MAG: glycosyltransferase [Fervidobacterium sp.]|uniref:glycosyltransferase n=1 Tax=Fervidobacterium sp. TaxID=1871331 RepID=UPI004049DBE0
MNVLVVSNLFPYVENKSSGIFLTNRIKLHKRFGVNSVAISLALKDSDMMIRFLKTALGRKENVPLTDIEDIRYEPVFLERGVLAAFEYAITSKRRLVDRASKVLVERIVEYYGDRLSKVDLIHAHGMYASVVYSLVPAGLVAMSLSRMLNMPYVVSLHGNDVNKYMKKAALRDLYLDAMENASVCIFVSNALLKTAKRYGYSGKNAAVIPNGFEPKIFRPLDKEETRSKLGFHKKGYKYVGFVGNLIPVKRADKLAEIFKIIKEMYPNVFFIVVGDGYLRNKIEKQTGGLEILFTGRISQEKVAEYMSAMDVMILPSRSEGWPCVVLEAQACGTCVVGSNNGGIPEAIGFDECVVKEGEDFEERFAQRVVEVLENGYNPEIFVERARRFTWEEIVKMEVELYKQTVNKSKQRA